MNLGVVTLNLPRIALETRGDRDAFWALLDERLDDRRSDALLFRVDRCREATPGNAPILYRYGAFGQRLDPDDAVDQLFRDGRATVSLGYIGLYEAAAAFFGGAWEGDAEAKDFTLDILRTLAAHAQGVDRRARLQVQRLLDAEREPHRQVLPPGQGEVRRRCEDITDKDYYTNSFHYDVRKNPTPFEKLDFEKDYPEFTVGRVHPLLRVPGAAAEPARRSRRCGTTPTTASATWAPTPRSTTATSASSPATSPPPTRGFACPDCGNDDPRTLRRGQADLRLPRQPAGPADGARAARGDLLARQAHGRRAPARSAAAARRRGLSRARAAARQWLSDRLSQDHVADYKPFMFVDGEGVRCSLYVSGCLFACEGCFNEAAWSFRYGSPYSPTLEDRILADLAHESVQGLTLLGGEPFLNTGVCLRWSRRLRARARRAARTSGAWSGYTFEELLRRRAADKVELLGQLDVLVDGPFTLAERTSRCRSAAAATSASSTCRRRCARAGGGMAAAVTTRRRAAGRVMSGASAPAW